MIESYRLISKKVDYPLHIGVTESGTIRKGTIKSSVGIGALLAEGIGDTLRVSLTGDPVEEIVVGKEILKSLGHIKEGIELISCPTCGRTQLDLIRIAQEVEERLASVKKHIKIAVMGCAVNGPGEARRADIGIAGGNGEGLIFKKGEIIRKVKEEDLVEELIKEVQEILEK
ncbi:MAG: flavodoxin-dependent (E)-4-hydroxy-3-methylbut-2-enyl-diphosphate synthase, partial [Clostridia bacterium]|nr:flavodoxin-dependent (E)-4-hydroxy-3-methylbut-2-enyl-diphosphate synthase [Clostridia bacterium]